MPWTERYALNKGMCPEKAFDWWLEGCSFTNGMCSEQRDVPWQRDVPVAQKLASRSWVLVDVNTVLKFAMTVRAYLYLTGPLAGIISFISLSFISLSMLVYQLGTLWLVYNSSYDCYTWKATPRAVTGISMWGRLVSNPMKSVPVIILWATNTRRKASCPSLLVARSLT